MVAADRARAGRGFVGDGGGVQRPAAGGMAIKDDRRWTHLLLCKGLEADAVAAAHRAGAGLRGGRLQQLPHGARLAARAGAVVCTMAHDGGQ